MKALKYGIILCLGLCMMGAPALAQSGSGQSQDVTPNHPNNLPDLAPAPNNDGTGVGRVGGWPRRDIIQRLPKDVENAWMQNNITQAVELMESYVKKSKENPCDLMLLRFSFYRGLSNNDSYYKAEADSAMKQLEKNCPNRSSLYLMKAEMATYLERDSLIPWLTKAIEVEPYPDIYTERGKWLMVMGQHKKGCLDFQKAMEQKDAEAKFLFMQYNCEGFLNEPDKTE